MQTNTQLGNKIAHFVLTKRNEKGLSQTALALKTRIARSSISNIEKGFPPTVNNLDEVLKGLDLSWADMAKHLDTYGELNETK